TSNGYDLLNANGNVNLGGSTLNVSVVSGYTPTVGNTFTIIASSNDISGTFAGLAEGSTLTASNQDFTISYLNHNVTLTYQGPHNLSTTTTVASSANPSTYGNSVVFTATVTSTATPTGSVNFQIDGGSLIAGTAGSTTGNTATWTHATSTLTVAATAHTIQTFYTHSATGNFTNSNGTTSGGQTVNAKALTV